MRMNIKKTIAAAAIPLLTFLSSGVASASSMFPGGVLNNTTDRTSVLSGPFGNSYVSTDRHSSILDSDYGSCGNDFSSGNFNCDGFISAVDDDAFWLDTGHGRNVRVFSDGYRGSDYAVGNRFNVVGWPFEQGVQATSISPIDASGNSGIVNTGILH